MEAAVAYLHVIGFIAIGAALAVEWVMLGAPDDSEEMRQLGRVVIGYAVAGAVVLATGALRLAWLETPSFYLKNPVFYLKLALFVALVLVSIAPTRYMLRWRREAADTILPSLEDIAHVRRYVAGQLALFVLIPLFAVLAARGIGIPE